MIDMLCEMHDEGLIREGALDIFEVADSLDEIFDLL